MRSPCNLPAMLAGVLRGETGDDVRDQAAPAAPPLAAQRACARGSSPASSCSARWRSPPISPGGSIDTVDNWVRPWLPREPLAGHLSAVPCSGLRRRHRHRRPDPARIPDRQFRRPFAGQRSARRCSTARRWCAASIRASSRYSRRFSARRDAIPQGRAGRISGQGLLVDRVHFVGAGARSSPTSCRERSR